MVWLTLCAATAAIVNGISLETAAKDGRRPRFAQTERTVLAHQNCLMEHGGAYVGKTSAKHLGPPEGEWYDHLPDPLFDAKVTNPKIAMIMFVKNSVFNSHMWVKWLEQARRDKMPFDLQIHTMEDPTATMDRELLRYVTRERVWTGPCNLWRGQHILISNAMKDKSITHFMMLSENSVPVKPLSVIHQEITKRPQSRLCADEDYHFIRAESWWFLRRFDMELIHNRSDDMKKRFGHGCKDENTWYPPLKHREDRYGKPAAILRECFMFTDWTLTPHPCKVWGATQAQCSCKALKIMPHKNASGGHPATFFKVNSTAHRELLDSSFWFARKFSDGAFDEASAREAEWMRS